jgi:periplasmic divalent cation tolerance protein
MPEVNEFTCVLVTAPNITVARKLAALAVGERLVACANLIPKIESHYWWEGKLESSTEVIVLFKTAKARVAELERCVLRNHPYDTPAFVTFDLDGGNKKYLDWIAASIQLPQLPQLPESPETPGKS